MQFNEYQEFTASTAVYPNIGNNIVYPTLGLAGESGEVAEKVKKMIRDNNGALDFETRMNIAKELGDVLWYVSRVAAELGLSMDAIAALNMEKLRTRQRAGNIHGSGDNR